MSWTGNFGFGARLPEYSAENDRYCPIARARKFNRSASALDLVEGSKTTPTAASKATLRKSQSTKKKSRMAQSVLDPPEIMMSATMALSGIMSSEALGGTDSALKFGRTRPLPPIPISTAAAPVSPQTLPPSPQSPTYDNNQSAPPDATISFQSAYESDDALEIVKLILSREKLVTELKKIIQESESEFAVLEASGHADKVGA